MALERIAIQRERKSVDLILGRHIIGRADSGLGDGQGVTRITGSVRTEPISQHSSPRRRKASPTAPAWLEATEKSSPPDVSASVSIEARSSGTPGSIWRADPNAESTYRLLRFMPPLKLPASASLRAPGRSGSQDAAIASPPRDALTLEPGWPRGP